MLKTEGAISVIRIVEDAEKEDREYHKLFRHDSSYTRGESGPRPIKN